MSCLMAWTAGDLQAQQPNTASVGFTNNSDFNVIVIGYTIVNGVKKAGPALQLKKNGGKAFENGVPSGFRNYTVLDANNSRILANQQIAINRDIAFEIKQSNLPNRLIIMPASAP
jgi:hypothetical protein